MGNINPTVYTNRFFGSFLKSPTQMGSLSVDNSVTNISRLGTFNICNRSNTILTTCLKCTVSHLCFWNKWMRSKREFLQLDIILKSNKAFKGSLNEIFYFSFFHESVSPGPLSIQLGSFRIFPKIPGREIL
jgi:hypothetical protein